MTTQQVRDKTKTVTRRLGWLDLEEGELLCAIVKGMGLQRGEKIERICTIRVVNARRERLDRMISDYAYGERECIAEGFPRPHLYSDPRFFVGMFRASHKGCHEDAVITRIEFAYL